MASSFHDYMGEPSTLFDSFLFDNLGLMPLSGNLVGVDPIDFIGYLALGLGPTLYPLYASCRTTLHDKLKNHVTLYAYVSTPIFHFSAFDTVQSKEVPVYVNFPDPAVEQLSFPPKGTRIGPDNRFYVVYDSVGSNHSTTVVHLARHPVGYYPWSDTNFTTFAAMSNVYNTDVPATIPEYITPCANVMSDNVTQAHSSNDALITDAHHGARQIISGDSTSVHASQEAMSDSPTVYSWISYSVSTPADRKSTRSTSNNKKKKKTTKKSTPDGGLTMLIEACENWKKAVAHLRALLRLAVCFGEIDNPYLLNSERRASAIHNIWPRALLLADVSVDELEQVKSFNSSAFMTHASVLALVNPSLTEFLYDAKRLVLCSIGHSHAGFNLDGLAAGVLLIDMVQSLLQAFIRPKSNMLPIRVNSFAWFLAQQMAKEIMWHVVFRPYDSHGIRLVLANLEPDAFRNSDHPPFSTLSLLGTSCYAALLQKYSILIKVPVELIPHYPTTDQVFAELRETVTELVSEYDDEDHLEFMANLSQLCNIL
ncbi:hypothetical protein C8R48DRAFT_672281 [Suillus tomentosus]|nr:hypothetical protein C8R48DRAFT_672281 [Suillus tomentosus]